MRGDWLGGESLERRKRISDNMWEEVWKMPQQYTWAESARVGQ